MLFLLDIILSKPFLMHLAFTVFQVQNTTLEKKIFHNKFSKSGKNHFITTDLAAPLPSEFCSIHELMLCLFWKLSGGYRNRKAMATVQMSMMDP